MTIQSKLGVIFLLTTVSSMGFGGIAGYHIRKSEEKPCPSVRPIEFKDMTRKQAIRWQRFRENEAKGWIK